MTITCDQCGGAGCLKCGYYGSLAISEQPKWNGYRIAAGIIWYGFLGIFVGVFVLWCLKGF